MKGRDVTETTLVKRFVKNVGSHLHIREESTLIVQIGTTTDPGALLEHLQMANT